MASVTPKFIYQICLPTKNVDQKKCFLFSVLKSNGILRYQGCRAGRQKIPVSISYRPDKAYSYKNSISRSLVHVPIVSVENPDEFLYSNYSNPWVYNSMHVVTLWIRTYLGFNYYLAMWFGSFKCSCVRLLSFWWLFVIMYPYSE